MGPRRFYVTFTVLFFTWVAVAETPNHAALNEMSRWIAACIDKKDTSHPVFHGCWDWHSAAHGHWALFRIALATDKSSEAVKKAETKLTPAALAGVEAELAASLEFENPYGRSWFLPLAIDFERWADKNAIPNAGRFRRIADEVAESILRYFESTTPTPLSFEYKNASWAFYQLHAYFDFVGDAARLRVVRGIIQTSFVSSEAQVSFADKSDFFSVYGNWAYLIAKTQSEAVLEEFLKAHPIGNSLEPITPTTNHSMGLNWSRAWALKALSEKVRDIDERRRFSAAYEKHVRRGLSDHLIYREDYRAYGHWVPQFAVYALTE